MIQSKRYEGAGKMVSLLAKFFRISLSQGNDIIPLQKELEHAVSYLSIQNIRFGDKFTFHVEFDETLGDCLCPKLIIQPLLENAVYHGMEGMYEDGEIVIKIYAVDDLVRIDVIDNGEGMTEEQVAKMMQGNVVSSKRGSGIGVKNVNDRVRLYFGDTYGVTILSALDEGTTARITFPARRQLDETAS
ncbi:MAG: sensor histidine kinase [Ruminococcus sp.]